MKRIVFRVLFFSLLLSVCCAYAADETSVDEGTPQQESLQRVETVVYGAPSAGGMFLRLAKVERDLFGMDLPGSLTERQQALRSFIEEGTPTQPSLVFKIGVAEWVTLSKVSPSLPLADRMSNLEITLEGEPQVGALSARLERILTKLLPDGVSSAQAQIPAATILKASFAKTLTVRNVSKGDIVELNVTEDCVVGGVLAIAKGDRLFAEVTNVKMPRSFGRTSEISVEFREAEAISGRRMPVTLGPQAKKAMEIDSGAIGAAGASIAGAVLLGPLGLAGGFLVRGSDKQIPAGSLVYVETSEDASAVGYPISEQPAPAETATGTTVYDTSQQEQSDFIPIDESPQTPPPGENF
ncbi:MAG: hypothetical protein LBL05_06020 [Synergistaceae bacterium]|jgi:hypothetical protein|nr:hypothetical protein [Synergistaceae bacterium]